MSSSWKHVTRRMSLGLGVALLMVLLAACGGGSSGSTGTTPTPKASTPTPTPTPAVAMQTYTGNGFTVSYPQGWTPDASNSQGISQVAITDKTTGNAFTIVATPDPGGISSADKLADASIQALSKAAVKDGKAVSVDPSVTINGVTWAQRAITGTTTVNGQSVPVKVILLVTVHPASAANSQAYQLIYGGPTLLFDQTNTQIFQPMLQSFKFTA